MKETKKQQNCDFCNTPEPLLGLPNYVVFINKNKLILDKVNVITNDEQYEDTATIKFCPICGRKLGD
jgi:hypothetical protein